MDHSVMILLAILIPVLWGVALFIKPEDKKGKAPVMMTAIGLLVTVAISLSIILGPDTKLMLFSIGKNMDIFFRVDGVGRLFATLVTVVWTLTGFYGFEYMSHDKKNKRFFGKKRELEVKKRKNATAKPPLRDF
jgi:multicomponent Na+:H+ antiporter subunit D